ncbi:hypothetical protein MIR68_008171 [Amoeboaphelidium protococcarum]|nr:hypothetical protein MIR68_008171 [Amoeboaphelidium protococcarum]
MTGLSLKSALVSVGALLSVSLVGYAVYFDYRRRNDTEFRRSILKSKKLVEQKQQEEEKQKQEELLESLQKAMDLVKAIEYPKSADERERFFMAQIQAGEKAYLTGAPVHESAAFFYAAVKICPNQMELLMILQKTAPADVVSLVYAMVTSEEQTSMSDYFKRLCSKYPTVGIKARHFESSDPEQPKKVLYSLVAARDLKADDVIYIEDPTVSVLNIKTMQGGQYCHNSLEYLPESESGDFEKMISCELCRDKAVFSTTADMERAMGEYHMILCPGNSACPQAKVLYDYCVANQCTYPMMVAKFMARMVWKQTVLAQTQKNATQEAQLLEEWEHLERLPVHQLDVQDEALNKEAEMVRDVLKFAAPNADKFLTVERYAAIKGAFIYNSVGIVPESENAIEGSVATTNQTSEFLPRSSYSPDQVIGSGLYFVTSYASHSCTPNAVASYKFAHTRRHKYKSDPLHTYVSPKLVLRASTDIKQGELITMAYVECHNSTSLENRWVQLIRTWGEACICTKCKDEEQKLMENINTETAVAGR